MKTKIVNNNIVNKISGYVVLIIIIFISCIGIYIKHTDYNTITNKSIINNSVELSARYKNCIVVDKCTTQGNYFLYIENPYLKQHKRSLVKVTENIYYNIYFIGDTIK